MAILKVARLGHPVLRQKARQLAIEEIHSDQNQRLILDMIETMKEYGGIGLAAPQVHQSVQIAVIGFSKENPRYPDSGECPLRVMINPRVQVLEATEQGFWEGCLSVPDIRGLVYRPRKIQVDWQDERGVAQCCVAEGFLATVFQHELDHLDGVLYVDRMRDTTRLAFLDEYQRYWAPPHPSEDTPGEDEGIGELSD